MKKIVSFILIGFILSVGNVFAERGDKKEFRQGHKQDRKAFWSTKRAENKEFRKEVKALPEGERASAVVQHREGQYTEAKEFREKMHGENMAFLQDKLAKNQKLTDAQKTDLIEFMEKQHQENISFRDQQHAESMAFFEQIANDSNLTQEQKKEAIQKHWQDQKTENKTYRKEQHSEYKDYKDLLKTPE